MIIKAGLPDDWGTQEVPPHQVGNPDVGHSDTAITVYKWSGCQPLLIKCFKMIIGIQSSIIQYLFASSTGYLFHYFCKLSKKWRKKHFLMMILDHAIWESLRLLTVQCRSAIDLRGPDCTQCWLWSSPNNGNVVNRARSLLSSLKK